VAIEVKPLDQSAEKFQTNAQGASTRYGTNTANAAERWHSRALASTQTFTQAIASGNLPKLWARGIQRAGAAKYRAKVEAHGESRYSSGVGTAGDDWQAGFTPYAQTLAGLTLPARRPRGDAANYQRVQAVGSALHAKRLAQVGAS